MAHYTSQKGMDFWWEFDNNLKPSYNPPPEVMQAYGKAFSRRGGALMNQIVDLARDHSGDDLAAQFNDVERAGLQQLAEIQYGFMIKHFPDLEDVQRAFEDFGQGVLLDTAERGRYEGDLVHMMDGDFRDNSCVGYHRWHAFNKVFLALQVPHSDFWSKVDSFVALAWAIQSDLDPTLDVANPPMDAARLQELRDIWLVKSQEQLDQAYLSYPGNFPEETSTRAPGARIPATPAGAPLAPFGLASAERGEHAASSAESAAAHAFSEEGIGFAQVREMLERATGTGRPAHTGKKKFWNAPLEEVLTMKVHNHRVIADEGENRGQRSGLVQALRGTLPRIPRMPAGRPPLPAADIDKIEKWIDAGCPEQAGSPSPRM